MFRNGNKGAVVGCDTVLGMIQVMEAGRSESIKDTIWFLGKGIACLGEKENIRSPRMGNRRFNCTRGWTYWDTQYCDSVRSVLLSAGLTDRRSRLIFRDLKFSMTTRLLFALFCVAVNALKAKHVAHANEFENGSMLDATEDTRRTSLFQPLNLPTTYRYHCSLTGCVLYLISPTATSYPYLVCINLAATELRILYR
jgi:hypothetical protein